MIDRVVLALLAITNYIVLSACHVIYVEIAYSEILEVFYTWVYFPTMFSKTVFSN